MAASTLVLNDAALDYDKLFEKVALARGVYFKDGLVLLTERQTQSIPTTSSDEAADKLTLISAAPLRSRLHSIYLQVADLDSDATPAIVHKLVIGGVDVVTGITAGQGGGVMLTGNNLAALQLYDTSGKSIQLEVTTPADVAQAGNLIWQLGFVLDFRTARV